MKDSFIPTFPQITRETLTVIAGALLAAVILNQLPALKKWLHAQLSTAAPTDYLG